MTDMQSGPPNGARRHHSVMVSSTYNDLHDLRKVLFDAALAAGLFPEAMEHDGALPGLDVIDSSLAKVKRAAGYALLIGQRYGQRTVCPKRNAKKLSITELEFTQAIECGAAIVVFMLGDRYPLPTADTDRTTGLVRKLEAFRKRAMSMDGSGRGVHRVYKIVNSEAELRQAAERSMRELARHLDEQSSSSAPPSASPPTSTPPDPTAEPLLPAPPARCALPVYVGSHEFVGRGAELGLLDDWAAAEDQHPVLLFDAIGGSGKSMLTWHWFEHCAPARREWAGRFWYSFYEAGASMADCCRHALAYITRQPTTRFQKASTPELTRQLVAHLQARPWLLVLDGFERVLVAYHRSDAATIADEALAQPTDEIGERNPCAAARPDDDELLRQLSAAQPSKVLVTSRLMPQALLNRAHQPIPGVRRESLRGLRPDDAVRLLQRCGVRGDVAVMQRFVQAHCDGHPLVVGALAGLIVEPLPAAGDFDAWSAHPDGGAALDLGQLDLVQKRNHILRAAIAAVPEKGRELLATLALLHGGVDRAAIEALNPHRPAEPDEVPEPDEPEQEWDWKYLSDEEKSERSERYAQRQGDRADYLKAHAVWRASPELKAAPMALPATLRDLQRRGLLQVGEGAEPHFDLHPVVRGVVSTGLGVEDTTRLGQRVIDHFSQRAHSPYEQAETLQEIEGGFHIVRMLLRMGRFQEAWGAWNGGLADAAVFNLLAWKEILALLKPFFPAGWLQPPQGIDEATSSVLMSWVAITLNNQEGLREQAVQLYGATLRLDATRQDLSGLWTGLSNLASGLMRTNRLANVATCGELALRVAEASDNAEQLFRAKLDAFTHAAIVGDWPRADALWASLDGLGRDWNRRIYRPGTADYWQALSFWWQCRSPAEPLAKAEQLLRAANARAELRNALDLRGEWHLAEGDAVAAVAAFDESARLERASGRNDLATESWLALARLQAGQLADPRAEAERLRSAGSQAHYPLARLWQAAGDLAQARAQALQYYRWAWSDGEPYVWRFDLERARKLLVEIGEPVPDLPPYDLARRQRFDWQDEVEAAIAEIEEAKAREKAEHATEVDARHQAGRESP